MEVGLGGICRTSGRDCVREGGMQSPLAGHDHRALFSGTVELARSSEIDGMAWDNWLTHCCSQMRLVDAHCSRIAWHSKIRIIFHPIPQVR